MLIAEVSSGARPERVNGGAVLIPFNVVQPCLRQAPASVRASCARGPLHFLVSLTEHA